MCVIHQLRTQRTGSFAFSRNVWARTLGTVLDGMCSIGDGRGCRRDDGGCSDVTFIGVARVRDQGDWEDATEAAVTRRRLALKLATNQEKPRRGSCLGEPRPLQKELSRRDVTVGGRVTGHDPPLGLTGSVTA